MWDFSDYNLNHTFIVMLLLYEEVVRVLIVRGAAQTPLKIYTQAKNDLSAALQFVLNARKNTYLSDNETGVIGQIIRGLQSGERGTSFINSLCNMVDTKVANRAGKALLGYNLIEEEGDRQGDDVFLTTHDAVEAVLLCCLLNLTGSAGQLYKISSDYGGDGHKARGEFLRYAYDAAANAVSGYPLRALTGFTHGEYQSEPVPDVFDRAGTLVEQVAKLARRGVSIPASLLQAMVQRNAAIVRTVNGKKKRLVADILTTLTPSVMGGVGVTITKTAKSLVSGTFGVTMNRAFSRATAIYVPSGEGKSTLARSQPSTFVDHDDLIDPFIHLANLSTARETGDWGPVNKYLRSCVPPNLAPRTLLTWGPECHPSDVVPLGAVLRIVPSGLRANKQNRASIVASITAKKIKWIKTPAHLLDAAIQLRLAFNAPYPGQITITGRGSPLPLPTFSVPLPGARAMLKSAKTVIGDFGTLRRIGFKRTEEMDKAILESGMSGGYPKSRSLPLSQNTQRTWTNGYRRSPRLASMPPCSTSLSRELLKPP